jgi:predicted GIY-YIG superfamily endonuclease
LAVKQLLLFPDARPLVERLGREFFRSLPESPGVYLMRDAADGVLYVGKAKNLRRRLGSYRVANPERMPRRHLRMLGAVMRIELRECPDEASALARESELLRSLRPKFNRAGTWPAKPRFLAWRGAGEHLELAVAEQPDADWETFGPTGRAALLLRNALARLFWSAVHPAKGPSQMPCGWIKGRFEPVTQIHTAKLTREAAVLLRSFFGERTQDKDGKGTSVTEETAETTATPPALIEWLRARVQADPHPFDKAAIETDLERLAEFVANQKSEATAEVPGSRRLQTHPPEAE